MHGKENKLFSKKRERERENTSVALVLKQRTTTTLKAVGQIDN